MAMPATPRGFLFLSLLQIPILALSTGGALLAAEQKIVLKEYLGQTWERQLVTYPFSAPEGACNPSSLHLTGPAGPRTVQLSEIALWPDQKTAKTARVSFITDLPPRGSYTFTLSCRPGSAATQGVGEALSVHPGNGTVDIVTSRFSARLLLGEKTYIPPAPPGQVPGPLLGLSLGDGTEFGSSRLFGKTAVTSYQARLLDAGGVFARVEYRYTYADGNALHLIAQVNSGDTGIMWDTEVKDDRKDDGVDFLLSRDLPSPIFPVHMEWFTKRKVFLDKQAKVGDLAEIPLDTYRESLVTKLTPWDDWWDDYTQTVILLKIPGKGTNLQIASRDPGAWVKPAAPGTMRGWDAWQHKLIPLNRADNGEIYLRINNAQGIRRFTLSQGAPAVGHQLDMVKDMVLDWPERPDSHPRLFASRDQVKEYFRTAPHDVKQIQWILGAKPEIRPEPSYKDAWALEAWLRSGGRADIAAQVQLPQRLRQDLSLLGKFDMMRSTGIVATLYDSLIDTDLVTAEERPLYRAQIAYLAYKLNDPATWSIERGYRSSNENMSVSHMLARGILACLLADHPMAKTWVELAIGRMKQWMRDVGSEGEWSEGGHYDQTTYSAMIWFALAAKRAGFYDFSLDPAFLRFGMYIAKQQTPLDPQRGNRRVSPPLGRAQGGEMWSHLGLLAALTRDTQPQYSRIMQWCWAQTAYDMKVMDARLAGFEVVLLDPNQPAEKPDWGSDWFPKVGAILRNGVGTAEENYVNLLTNSKADFARVSEVGALLKWFAKGRPIAGLFSPGYSEREELLVGRVLRARTWRPGDNWFLPFGNATSTGENLHAFLPRADYVNTSYTIGGPYDANWWAVSMPAKLIAWPSVAKEGQPPFDWRRQVLYLKDDDPGGPNYLVLRDTINGNQPTMWQLWTISEKVGTPEEAADRKVFLADKPGERAVPPRQLAGDRFTALGQLDLDLEYFLASPSSTPRWTLRFGTPYQDYGVVGEEYQDLLQIQMPGDGAYFVALYPRLRTEPVPVFTTLGGGHVIKVAGEWGTDYAFLSATEATAQVDGGLFRGTSGCIQDRRNGLILALNAAGEVAYKQFGVQADQPVSVRVRGMESVVDAPAGHGVVQVVLTLQGEWKPARLAAGVKWARLAEGKYLLTLPAGVRQATLARG